MNVRKKPVSKTPAPKTRVRKEIAEKKVPSEETLPDLDIVAYAPKQMMVTNQRHVLETKVMAYFNKKYGAGTAVWLEDVPVMPKVSTGIEQLDGLLLGGMEVGGVVTIQGHEQSGKTSLALQIAGAEDGGVVYIDAEGKISQETAHRFGAHGNFIIVRPTTLEDAFGIARFSLKAGIKLVVIDSLPALVPAKEDEETSDGKVTGIAPHAGLLHRKLGVLNTICRRNQSTLLIVNQLRENTNMSPFPGAEKYHPFGGRQLRSLCKLCIDTARKDDIKIGKDKVTVGQTLVYRIRKSSFCPPRGTGEICILFREGMRLRSELKDMEFEAIAEPIPQAEKTAYMPSSVRIQEVQEFTEGVTDDSGEPTV